MFLSGYFITTLTLLVTFICVVHLMEVPNNSNDIATEVKTNDKHDSDGEDSLTKTSEDRIAVLEEEIMKIQKEFEALSTGSHDGIPSRREKRHTSEYATLPDNTQACDNDGHAPQIGIPGQTGCPGMQGLPGRDGRDLQCENRSSSAAGGSVYIRWGRTDCPEVSDLIYDGIAAGSRHRDSPGGGANQLCVPRDPLFVNPVAGEGSIRAFIYSVAYQMSNFPRSDILNKGDVPCAVCNAKSRFSNLMIPGRNVCPSSEWTLEYSGYLMAERSHEVHYRSMFICVDRNMQKTSFRRPNVPSSANGALLSLVEGKCSGDGGLPCDEFTAGYEFTCAVCTM